jgi:hypothetical protein
MPRKRRDPDTYPKVFFQIVDYLNPSGIPTPPDRQMVLHCGAKNITLNKRHDFYTWRTACGESSIAFYQDYGKRAQKLKLRVDNTDLIFINLDDEELIRISTEGISNFPAAPILPTIMPIESTAPGQLPSKEPDIFVRQLAEDKINFVARQIKEANNQGSVAVYDETAKKIAISFLTKEFPEFLVSEGEAFDGSPAIKWKLRVSPNDPS